MTIKRDHQETLREFSGDQAKKSLTYEVLRMLFFKSLFKQLLGFSQQNLRLGTWRLETLPGLVGNSAAALSI